MGQPRRLDGRGRSSHHTRRHPHLLQRIAGSRTNIAGQFAISAAGLLAVGFDATALRTALVIGQYTALVTDISRPVFLRPTMNNHRIPDGGGYTVRLAAVATDAAKDCFVITDGHATAAQVRECARAATGYPFATTEVFGHTADGVAHTMVRCVESIAPPDAVPALLQRGYIAGPTH